MIDHAGLAAGGLVSTAADLLSWDRALYGHGLLSEASKLELFSAPRDGYALGWYVATREGRVVHAHSGELPGYTSYLAPYPADRTLILVLSNLDRTNAQWIVESLEAILYSGTWEMPRDHKPVTLPPHLLDRYTGEYELGLEIPLFVRREGDRLFADVKPFREELLANSETDFYLQLRDVEVRFEFDTSGQVTGILWDRTHAEER